MLPIPKIEISGENARPIVDAIIDVFSPAAELFGWLGDSIRVHRTRTVLECFAKTKKIAAEAGIKLKAPPAKFLTQYIENCSIEDESDHDLIEWWARLLVDAGTKYDAKQVFYANVLKQLSATELELLEVAVKNGSGRYRLENVSEAEFVHDFNFPGDNIVLADKFERKQIIKSMNAIRSEFEMAGVIILDIFVDDEESRQIQATHPDYDERELSSWQILQSLQLIRLSYRRFVSGTVEYRVRLALITELGAKFYFSCHDSKLQHKWSDEAKFKRKHKISNRSKYDPDFDHYDFSLEAKSPSKRSSHKSPRNAKRGS